MAEEKHETRAKLFMNGRSQAVRLPKEFRFQGTEVRIRRSGNGVLLEPMSTEAGTGDLDAVQTGLETTGPREPESSAMKDEAMPKLEGV